MCKAFIGLSKIRASGLIFKIVADWSAYLLSRIVNHNPYAAKTLSITGSLPIQENTKPLDPLNIAFHKCAELSPCHISFTLSFFHKGGREAKTRIISSCIQDPRAKPMIFLGSRGLINGDDAHLLCRRKAFHIESALPGESVSKSLP